MDFITALHRRSSEFQKRFAGAVSQKEKRTHIIEFARDLGASRAQLRKDSIAFKRWFGADTVQDRYRIQIADAERKMQFYLDRLATLAKEAIKSGWMKAGFKKQLRRLKIEALVIPILAYNGDTRVRIAGFKCLTTVLKSIPEAQQQESVGEDTLRYVFQAALNPREEVWIQCEAIKLLETLSLESLKRAIAYRLEHPAGLDDFFVRSQAVRSLANNLKRLPELENLLSTAAHDSSPYVRQAFVDSLNQLPEDSWIKWLDLLGLQDEQPQVRGAALLKIIDLVDRTGRLYCLAKLLVQSLDRDDNSFVLRVGLEVAVKVTEILAADARETEIKKWSDSLKPSVIYLRTNAGQLAVRRWAAQAGERMWSEAEPDIRQVKQALLSIINPLKAGRKARIPKSFVKNINRQTFGRLCAVICQNDFPVAIRYTMRSISITKGELRRFRMWRLLHELRHASPDKRQAYPHTIGRIFPDPEQVPSGILSELSAAKVPGEPLHMPEESGWRPYLPLVDQMISALNENPFSNKAYHIYSSEGITHIFPPRSILRRFWSWSKLTLSYTRFARWRNWTEVGAFPPITYINALSKLGCTVTFMPYQDGDNAFAGVDDSVMRFFQDKQNE